MRFFQDYRKGRFGIAAGAQEKGAFREETPQGSSCPGWFHGSLVQTGLESGADRLKGALVWLSAFMK
jgi:hypothetical protein